MIASLVKHFAAPAVGVILGAALLVWQECRLDSLTAKNAKQTREIALWAAVADQLTERITAAATALAVREEAWNAANTKLEENRQAVARLVRQEPEARARPLLHAVLHLAGHTSTVRLARGAFRLGQRTAPAG